MFYDGNSAPEPGAIVCRVSPRLFAGHFEIFAAKRKRNYSAHHPLHQPDTLPRTRRTVSRACLAFLVTSLTHHSDGDGLDTVGFVHGVRHGQHVHSGLDHRLWTVWLAGRLQPAWTPNTTDAQGRRYAFGRQPSVALWNLSRLASALYPLIEDVDPLKDRLEAYQAHLSDSMHSMMLKKLGLLPHDRSKDEHLIDELLRTLGQVETDMTLFYRTLGELDLNRVHEQPALVKASMAQCYYQTPLPTNAWERTYDWLKLYREHTKNSGVDEASRQVMQMTNPLYVMRNFWPNSPSMRLSRVGLKRLNNCSMSCAVRTSPRMEKYSAKRPGGHATDRGARCCLVVPKPRVLSLGPSNLIHGIASNRSTPSARALNALRNCRSCLLEPYFSMFSEPFRADDQGLSGRGLIDTQWRKMGRSGLRSQQP